MLPSEILFKLLIATTYLHVHRDPNLQTLIADELETLSDDET